jgi:putative ABC transport system substrate-binding protein
VRAFVDGMRDYGHVEGKNLILEWRFADGEYERLPTMAAELVSLKVDVIVAAASPAIRAAQRATTSVPIVFPSTGDPVGSGFVASLARPGGNITGLSNSNLDVSSKLLELLAAIVHGISRVAVLGNPASSTHPAVLQSIQAAGRRSDVKILPVDAGSPETIERSFSAIRQGGAQGVIVASDALLLMHRSKIAKLALQHRLPSISQEPLYAEAGGLMSYGHNLNENYRRVAHLVDKILKGAKPGELPVEQPTTFEFLINRTTAKRLGLAIPSELLVRADRVID